MLISYGDPGGSRLLILSGPRWAAECQRLQCWSLGSLVAENGGRWRRPACQESPTWSPTVITLRPASETASSGSDPSMDCDAETTISVTTVTTMGNVDNAQACRGAPANTGMPAGSARTLVESITVLVGLSPSQHRHPDPRCTSPRLECLPGSPFQLPRLSIMLPAPASVGLLGPVKVVERDRLPHWQRFARLGR